MACMCTVSLGMKAKILAGCAPERDVCRPEAVVPKALAASARRRRVDGNLRGVELSSDAPSGAAASVALLSGLDDPVDPPLSQLEDGTGRKADGAAGGALAKLKGAGARDMDDAPPEAVAGEGIGTSAAVVGAYFVAFFFLGIAIALPWGAMQVRVALWVKLFGPSIWPLMVASYNGPGILVLLLQKQLDDSVDRALGLYKAYMLRLLVPLFAVGTCMLITPSLEDSRNRSGLLIVAFILGVFNAAIYSWLFNVAGLIRPVLTSAVLGGAGLSVFVLLAITAFVGLTLPPLPALKVVSAYFEVGTAFPGVGIVAALIALNTRSVRAILNNPANVPKAQSRHTTPSATSLKTEQHMSSVLEEKRESSLSKQLRPLLMCSAVVNAANVTFSATISYVPSSTNNPHLPLLILVFSAVSMFIGNEAYVFVKVVNTRARLYKAMAVLFALLVLGGLYISVSGHVRDPITIGVVSVTSFVIAQVNSSIYGIVLTETPPSTRPRALTMTTIAVYVGTVVATGIALTLANVLPQS